MLQNNSHICVTHSLLLQGCAVKAGMLIGRGQHLLMADADGATRISDLAKLEAALKDLNDPGKLACCIPSAYYGTETQQQSGLFWTRSEIVGR